MSQLKEIAVPDIGQVTHAEVIEIAVAVGDSVQANDTLITLESDKATMEVPSPYAGKVKSLALKVGDKILTGSIILTLEMEGEKSAKAETAQTAEKMETAPKESAPVTNATTSAVHTSSEAPADDNDDDEDDTDASSSMTDVHAGPSVRRLARDLGVDLNQLTGSGLKNRIIKEDVEKFVKAVMTQQIQPGVSTGSTSAPALPTIDFAQFGPIETQARVRIKKITGINLTRNWQMIPHVTQFDEVDITELEAFRKSQQAAAEKAGVKLTPIVFLMKAVVAALKAFPQFNASLDATGENLILKRYFHIGVAVDTPQGLVVPVIKDVDQKGFFELARELADISTKARGKGLAPAEMQGGCFTISSLGGIGGTAFTPIVNWPEVAILGVSKSAIRPVYSDGNFVPRLHLPLSLSYDHRVIDGAEGARFIVYLSGLLADIRRLLL